MFECMLHHLNSNSGAYTVLATLCLVLLTTCYVLLTWRLTNEAQRTRKEQAELQERQSRLQTELQQRQLKHDLYEKRLSVFVCVMRFLSAAGRRAEVPRNDAMQLLRDTLQAEFLFDHETVSFIDEIYRKSNELSDTDAMLNPLPEGTPRRAALQEKRLELEKWLLITAFDTAKQRFKPYLLLHENPPGT